MGPATLASMQGLSGGYPPGTTAIVVVTVRAPTVMTIV
jgi:hypothetical protein